MLSHVHIGVDDFDLALDFYGVLLAELGWRLRFVERDRPWAGWSPAEPDRPLVLVGRPFDGRAASPGNGAMVAFTAPTREHVDCFHATALRLGGRDEGAPGLRPEYHPTYYGAYVRDPEGAKLCACCHR